MKTALILFLAAVVLAPPNAFATGRRSVSGIVYFTNNTPPGGSVLVELYTRDMKRMVASKRLGVDINFDFRNVRPGEYVLKVSWEKCNLRYKVDLRAREHTSLRIIADADCAHSNGKLLPEPLSP